MTMYLPVKQETLDQFYGRGPYTNLQQAYDAGKLLLHSPNDLIATWESSRDLGAVIAQNVLIRVTTQRVVLAGNVNFQTDIGTSTDGIAITWATNTETLLSSDFRYVHVRLTATALDDTGLMQIDRVSVRISAKKITDNGIWTITDAANGVVVSFNSSFADVESIVLTAPKVSDTYALVPSYDFLDIPNPTQFTVYCHRSDTGAKVTASGSWIAIGT